MTEVKKPTMDAFLVTETQFNKFKYTGDYVNMPEWEFNPT